MNPSIQGLLATLDQTCMIAQNRLAVFKLTPEQEKELVAAYAAAKTDREVLAGPSWALSKMILGEHKRLLLRNTYDAFETLSKLTFEEYVEFQALSDERALRFYSDSQPLITKLYNEQIKPLLAKDSFEQFFKNFFGEGGPFGDDDPFKDPF